MDWATTLVIVWALAVLVMFPVVVTNINRRYRLERERAIRQIVAVQYRQQIRRVK